MKKRAKPPKFNRQAMVAHDFAVDSPASETRFKIWAKEFAAAVTEVLLTIDSSGWECNPARDIYCRFGWDIRLTENDILEWWKYRLEHFQEMDSEEQCIGNWKPQIKHYKAAIRDLKAALR